MTKTKPQASGGQNSHSFLFSFSDLKLSCESQRMTLFVFFRVESVTKDPLPKTAAMEIRCSLFPGSNLAFVVVFFSEEDIFPRLIPIL